MTRVVTVNGARLAVDEAGEGAPVVLLHAAIADRSMWTSEFAALARSYRVVAPDLRGFGESEMPPGPYSHVDDVLALLDALGIDRAHLVGVSMGGSVALAAAAHRPERARSVVSVGATAGLLLLSDALRLADEEEAAAFDAGDLAWAADVNMRLWVDGPRRRPEDVDAAARARARMLVEGAVRREAERRRGERHWPEEAEDLEKVRAPVLLVVGGEDQPDMHAAADACLARMPDARKAVIEGAAHLPNLERPREFLALVEGFLAEVSGRGAR